MIVDLSCVVVCMGGGCFFVCVSSLLSRKAPLASSCLFFEKYKFA